MPLSSRLRALERAVGLGGPVDQPGAVCGACGGYHALNVAQLVAAGEGCLCTCSACGCRASALRLRDVLNDQYDQCDQND